MRINGSGAATGSRRTRSTPRRPLLLIGCFLLAVLAFLGLGARSAAAVDVTVSCSPAPADCTGWYRQPVTIDWTVFPTGTPIEAGCQDRTISTDTRGTIEFCSAGSPGARVIRETTIRVDRTRPDVLGAAVDRPPDGDGWYRQPVRIAFSGSDATSGVESCTDTTFAGPDGGAVSTTGTCRDQAGNTSAPRAFTVKYDATPPDIASAAPDRPFDFDGWFNHPVGFSFEATDATSGLATCDPATYQGPDGAGAAVTGACRDHAGNVATRAFPLRYDDSPPKLRSASAEPADREVRVRWRAPADATRTQVSRAPGLRGAAESLVYAGVAGEFLDRRVRNGRRYRYTLGTLDRAGNLAQRVVTVVPGRRLLRPRAKARRRKPPLLRWTRVRGADFYNVLLFRGGERIFRAWPRKPSLRLPRRWTEGGRVYRLSPGRYRWYVWPGRGRPSKPRYGALIGRRTFIIKR